MLLEVIVSVVILGISIATLMRSFTLSMNAIRRNDVTTQACVLAQSLLQKYEIEPFEGKVARGTFEEEGFPQYSYEAEFKEEEIRYKNLKTKSKIENLKPLYRIDLKITYDNKRQKSMTVLEMSLYQPPIERFDWKSKFSNELFKEER